MTEGAPLARFIASHRPVLVLTGAGCSTDSGIPDYRDESGQWRRRQPVTHQEFLAAPVVRQRYWARSMVGWPKFQHAAPNLAHRILADLEQAGYVGCLVTQNVDGLHQEAGQDKLIEIHGNIGQVVCMACGEQSARARLQQRLEELNPRFRGLAAPLAPDGDADFLPEDLSGFAIPGCEHCGGVLKPDVVFFGDNIPRPRVAAAMAALEQAAALLVVGSSLMVYSGFRFCQQAKALGKPIAVVNRGVTRADHLLDLKLEHSCAEILAATSAALTLTGPCQLC
ncbi:MAG: NAD-dependent protein deacetylase [Betaproteobacteria bacterium]|nr:NAD-dependent protein deacetylase [Betaproteobacteria bacterium]